MSSSQEQGGSGHARAAFEVAAPPQQHPRVPVILSPERQMYTGPLWRCILLCCIVIVAAGTLAAISVLGAAILYHPKSPKLQISDASLNAGYVDELPVPGGPSTGLALNADLTVLAVILSDNTKIDIELKYMQLDLYFKGHLIGTQVVLPAPVRKPPGGFVLSYVHFVASKVELPQEDAEVWKNATVQGTPVVLKVTGRFHTKLYVGPLIRFTYWVYRHCTLWFHPPPRGYMIKALC